MSAELSIIISNSTVFPQHISVFGSISLLKSTFLAEPTSLFENLFEYVSLLESEELYNNDVFGYETLAVEPDSASISGPEAIDKEQTDEGDSDTNESFNETLGKLRSHINHIEWDTK